MPALLLFYEMNDERQSSDKFADKQNEAQYQDQSENHELGIVENARSVSAIEEFRQRRIADGQRDEQSSKLEEAPHGFIVLCMDVPAVRFDHSSRRVFAGSIRAMRSAGRVVAMSVTVASMATTPRIVGRS